MSYHIEGKYDRIYTSRSEVINGFGYYLHNEGETTCKVVPKGQGGVYAHPLEPGQQMYFTCPSLMIDGKPVPFTQEFEFEFEGGTGNVLLVTYIIKK